MKYSGTVTFRAKYKSGGLKFPAFEYRPENPGIEKIEMKSPSGDEIVSIVHVAHAANRKEADALAEEVLREGLNRISFFHGAAIENARIVNRTVASGYSDSLRRVSPDCLRQQLEQSTMPGELPYFSLFRSARQSTAPVEEFMHLYNLLLMLLGDFQYDVEEFIRQEDPSVLETPAPSRPKRTRKPKTGQETIFTRLRNELGHPRPGTNLVKTKVEMAECLNKLVHLTKRAIERYG